MRRVDYLRYFRMDERFDALFRTYGHLADVGQYRIFQRGAAGRSPEPPPMRGSGLTTRQIAPGLEWDKLEAETIVRGVSFILVFAFVYRRRRGLAWK
ncbi:MAG: hypothetical protein H0T86_06855 [Gemmatimonadales bacterium]|nr:hypothetical protein [Gemmatimonadales bacterium]